MSGGTTLLEVPAASPPPLARTFLEAIGEIPRVEILAIAQRRRYPAGKLMLAELEPGDEMLIILDGCAAVAVGSSELSGEERLGQIGEGESVGEIALLTGALRSASVRAITPVTALALRRDQLLGLMSRFPVIADHFLTLLASRLSSAEQVLADALDPRSQAARLLGGLDHQTREIAVRRRPARRLLIRAFRELLIEHRRELPFFLLSSFLGSFVLARVGLWALSQIGIPFEPLLRTAYVGGVLLLLGSAGFSPFTYRRPVRVALCILFGTGAGLIVNELSVWLSFDIFYRDIFTRDPTLTFDPAVLYHRSTTLWVFTAVVVGLSQATYLSRFYRRAFYILRERWSGRSSV